MNTVLSILSASPAELSPDGAHQLGVVYGQFDITVGDVRRVSICTMMWGMHIHIYGVYTYVGIPTCRTDGMIPLLGHCWNGMQKL